MRFLGNVFSTVIGLFVFVFLLFAFFIFVGMVGSLSEQKVTVADNSVLRLQLNQSIQERIEQENPFEEFGFLMPNADFPIGLIELKKAIADAKNDDNIQGIYLDMSSTSAGFSTLQEIRESLQDFKSSGKFIVAYGEFLSEGAYYIASVADEVYVNPIGFMEFNGFSSQVMFFTGMFEKLGIKAEIFKVGDFKSAVEPFFRKDMSEENRLQMEVYLNTLHEIFLRNISESRKIEMDVLKKVTNDYLIETTSDAVKFGLVDKAAYFDEVGGILREKLGLDEDDKINFISLRKYQRATKNTGVKYNEKKVAVIVAEGTIVSGEGAEGYIGSDKIAAEIRKARTNDNIKAIVLRVNSPGGSMVASDVIWREVELAREAKPIIASMSDLAASGGYYISMACDTIVARENTITGSIGIFSVLLNTEELLTDKIGLSFDEVKTGKFADLGNPTEEMTEEEKAIFQRSVERGYEIFINKVADGRGMQPDEVKKVASGRVWAGAQANQNGLVDVIGGLDKSIEIAAGMANLEEGDYQVRYYPQKKDFWTAFMENSQIYFSNYFMKKELGEVYPIIKKVKELKQMEGEVQALLPYDFKLK
ncbi:signal peptide peptidase SppA [Flexithrix dorotheae]|uniref:signal peptide peptidase SppA n=1 Tax=Flexithrix dorotheae TaxID=70993 RepID=UPI000374B823|nr:signal peptide peptidase SppA [Flexithrix dorotheae]